MTIKSSETRIDKTSLATRIKSNRVALGISVALIILLYGNVKLVYLAVNSQPACVPHLKTNGDNDTNYIAARSSC